jgi:hypothetical protein
MVGDGHDPLDQTSPVDSKTLALREWEGGRVVDYPALIGML